MDIDIATYDSVRPLLIPSSERTPDVALEVFHDGSVLQGEEMSHAPTIRHGIFPLHLLLPAPIQKYTRAAGTNVEFEVARGSPGLVASIMSTKRTSSAQIFLCWYSDVDQSSVGGCPALADIFKDLGCGAPPWSSECFCGMYFIPADVMVATRRIAPPLWSGKVSCSSEGI
jgi:hypothetical protein